MYIYKIVKEDFFTGKRAKRTRTICRYEPLVIGGLYLHLGHGYPGAYRVLELISEEGSEDSERIREAPAGAAESESSEESV